MGRPTGSDPNRVRPDPFKNPDEIWLFEFVSNLNGFGLAIGPFLLLIDWICFGLKLTWTCSKFIDLLCWAWA